MYILVCTTYDNKEEAIRLSNELLEKKIISCYQMSDIRSSYWWNDKIETTDEVLVRMKTRKELFDDVKDFINNNHSYEVPEVISIDIDNGSKEYFDWMDKYTK